jgi:tetratricopeptide (TPR) repeat protein
LSAHAAPARTALGELRDAELLRALVARGWLAVTIAAAIVVACFYATGGLNLGPATTTEMTLTIVSGGLVAAAATQQGLARGRLWGLAALGAFLCLATFTALSVTWSVEPSDSWIETSRTFSYAATFAGGLALVRIAAGRWRSVIAGVLLATVVVAGYAIGTKVFPAGAQYGATVFARLNAPFNYWNVVGALAAMGIPPALWLGSRRDGHGALVALSPPAVCLLLVTVMLSYSRGSLLALVVGLVFWFAFVPLRLRSVSILAIGGIAAAVVVIWTFSQTALTTDNEPLAARTPAGHELGWLLLGVLVLCAAAGLALRFATLRNPPSAMLRRRVGKGLIVGLAIVPVIAVIGLAASSRGLFGSISHGVSTLTSTHVGVSNSANRLTALGSQRALYWSDAIKAFDTNPVGGSGAGSFQTTFLRYDKADNTLVAQAHSYVFQTLADLGILGLALSLALAAAWVAAAIRSVGPLRRTHGSTSADAPERIGLLTMIAAVVVFTADSTIDWTWFVPGVAMIAMFLAGWVAGRGPHDAVLALGRVRLSRLRREPTTAALAAAIIAVTLILAWSQWQPLRSVDSTNAAVLSLGNGESAHSTTIADADYRLAESDLNGAIAEDPLDYQPLYWLAVTQAHLDPGNLALAYATMVRAVRRQPANYQSWYDLAYFDYQQLNAVPDAFTALQRSLYLYPQNYAAAQLYAQLLAASSPSVKPAKHHASSKH